MNGSAKKEYPFNDLPEWEEGLRKAISTLDLSSQTSVGHLIDGRLGDLPLRVQHNFLNDQEALLLVNLFNSVTGLAVGWDENMHQLKR